MPSLGYNILAGTKGDEGVIIARERFGPANEIFLNAANGTWFIAQANGDQWINGCDDRCAAAHDYMTKVGQANTTLQTLRDALTTYPIIQDSTLYNTDFIPKTSFINTIPEDYHPTASDIANDKFGVGKPRSFKETFEVINADYKSFKNMVLDLTGLNLF